MGFSAAIANSTVALKILNYRATSIHFFLQAFWRVNQEKVMERLNLWQELNPLQSKNLVELLPSPVLIDQ